MKRVILILVLGALPAPAPGQAGTADAAEVRVICPAPCHVAPFFKGTGGFVGESVRGRSGAVDFALSCGKSVTERTVTESTVYADEMGVVRQVFTRANGLACDAEGGKIEISGLRPGGWYWIHDEKSSAVSSLVGSDSLGDGSMWVEPAAPGGVTITSFEGGGASFVKDEMSGRVGIIPHVVPVPDVPRCAWEEDLANNCELRASYDIVLKAGDTALGPNIVRGGEDGSTHFIVTVSLTGRGYIPVDPERPPGAAYRVAGPGSTEESPVGTPGVYQAFPSAEIGIEPEDEARCAATSVLREVPVRIVITATNPEGGLGAVPPLPEDGVSRTFTVSCPPLQ